jgi:hypothetical protein
MIGGLLLIKRIGIARRRGHRPATEPPQIAIPAWCSSFVRDEADSPSAAGKQKRPEV